MNDESIRDAYIYLLGRMLVVRQEMTDRAGDGFAYNTVRYNPLGSADFVNPNFDVAYLEAWIAVDDDTAVLLEVPEITGRYYTAQVLDEWGEVIVNINARATPVKPSGTFAFTKPGSNVSIPPAAHLAVETDGSLKIGLGANVPAGVAESNWLPAQPGERFSLTFRAYVPRDIVRTGQWAPPPIVRSP